MTAVQTFLFSCIFLTANFALAADWSMNLVWSGGGTWTQRIPVAIENATPNAMNGTPVAVELPAGVPTPCIRLTKADGTELVYGYLAGTPGTNATLLIPVEAETGQTAHYFVYFGNEKAIPVPDKLDARAGLTNGDLELGSGRAPEGWVMDNNTATHRNYWVAQDNGQDAPQSGTKCLKTVVVKGASATWSATRQSGIPVVGGATYRFKAWVRGEEVEGRAGWFIHVGHERNGQLINQVITDGGTGTFGWREMMSEFTAPLEANTMTVGTVLYGTGTAWFDNASLERVNRSGTPVREPRVTVGEVESIPYSIIHAETEWEHRLQEGWDYLCRSTFRIINPTDAALENVPVLMTLRGTQAHGLLGPLTDLTLADGSPVTWLDEENFRLTCNISVPAKTVKYFNVYYRFDEDFFLAQRHKEHEETFVSFVPLCETENQFDGQFDADTAHPELQRETDPLADLPNLVRNGDFENGTEGWNRNDANPPAGVRYSVERSPELVRFGTQALRLDVAPGTPVSWRGWTQRIEVKSSHSYLVQGWMRGIDLESARIHLHFHTADGGFTANGSMSSIDRDIAGTTDWTRVAEIITTPPDARLMSIHLTMNGTGTLLHDNITVVDGLFAEQIDRESYYTGDIRIWQVPAVMKVFPQTIPPKWVRESKQEDLVFRIEAARNEKEPMQIAMRGYRCRGIGGFSVYQWRYELSTRPFGLYYKRIDEIKLDADLDTMRTVGYVNIDYPSSYYNSTSPKWYRMLPTSAPGADGWAGLWPDPLLEWGNDPTQGFPEYFDGAGTEALWFTWSIPEYAQAGKYMGTFVVSEMSAGGYTVNQQYLNMEVRVRDFTLPDAPNLTAIYDVRFGPGGGRQWGNSERDIQREIVELMTANRLSPDVIMPSPGLTFQDGKPVFDWREFDEVAEWYFNELNVRQVYTPWLFYIFGWGHPPSDFFGERPYPGVRPFAEADFSQLRPEYKAKYQAALREFWNHITEKGWGDRFILYVSDEPNYWTPHIITQMQAVCAMIHEVDPSIPTFVSTWRYIPEWAESITVWGIGHYGIVPVETMKEIKEHGSRIWFTTDGMLCLDTPYNAIERLLPYYCFKFGADAYEFWGISWLTYDPYQYGSHAYIHQTSTPGEYYWVRYPNGDGYLLYPPRNSNGKIVSSIRFEQAREGMEDFEYFTMLSQLIEQGKQSGKDVTQGEAALAEALSLVESPTAIGRYSSRILPNPYRIYEVRRRVAEAIEGLGSPHNR